MTVDGLWNIGQGKYTKSDDINNKSVDNSDKKSIIELIEKSKTPAGRNCKNK